MTDKTLDDLIAESKNEPGGTRRSKGRGDKGGKGKGRAEAWNNRSASKGAPHPWGEPSVGHFWLHDDRADDDDLGSAGGEKGWGKGGKERWADPWKGGGKGIQGFEDSWAPRWKGGAKGDKGSKDGFSGPQWNRRAERFEPYSRGSVAFANGGSEASGKWKHDLFFEAMDISPTWGRRPEGKGKKGGGKLGYDSW